MGFNGNLLNIKILTHCSLQKRHRQPGWNALFRIKKPHIMSMINEHSCQDCLHVQDSLLILLSNWLCNGIFLVSYRKSAFCVIIFLGKKTCHFGGEGERQKPGKRRVRGEAVPLIQVAAYLLRLFVPFKILCSSQSMEQT